MKALLELILYNLVYISLALLQIFYFPSVANSIAGKIYNQIFGILLLFIVGFIDGIYFCIDKDDNEH